MRTTLDLPDDLFRKAKAEAALRGVPLKILFTNALRQELTTKKVHPKSSTLAKLPLIKTKRKDRFNISREQIDEVLNGPP